MRAHIVLLTFSAILAAPVTGLAASHDIMEKECTTVARSMMEEPAMFKFIDAQPSSKDQNKGVAIRFSDTKDDLRATLSCFYVNGEISKLHLETSEKNDEEINEYLADALVDQIKKDLRAK